MLRKNIVGIFSILTLLFVWISNTKAEFDTSNWMCQGRKHTPSHLKPYKEACDEQAKTTLCAYICILKKAKVFSKKYRYSESKAYKYYSEGYNSRIGKAMSKKMRACASKADKVDNSPNCLGQLDLAKCIANTLSSVCKIDAKNMAKESSKN